MELCLLLQFPSPEHLHATLTYGQVQRWFQFMQQVTIGERRDDLRFAQLIAHLRSAAGQKHQNPSDYLLDFYPKPEEQRSILDNLRAHMRIFAAQQR